MILEIEYSRSQIIALEKEYTAKGRLIEKLDEQIKSLTRIAELHRQAAADRSEALKLRDRIQDLYRQSLQEAKKEVEKLQRSNSFWKKAACGGTAIAFMLGLFVSK